MDSMWILRAQYCKHDSHVARYYFWTYGQVTRRIGILKAAKYAGATDTSSMIQRLEVRQRVILREMDLMIRRRSHG
jgi:hypothetical protein